MIVTTHYIDETRQAHMIGLMRGGKFLAEESPADLLAKYQAETLEDVFLKLAVLQNMGKRRRSSIAQEVVEQIRVPAIANQRWTCPQRKITEKSPANSVITFQCPHEVPTRSRRKSKLLHCLPRRTPRFH